MDEAIRCQVGLIIIILSISRRADAVPACFAGGWREDVLITISLLAGVYMKRVTVAVVTGVVAVIGLMTSGIEAQTSANPVSDAIRAMYDSAKKNIKDSAMVSEATQAIFDFKPVDAVRTFGQVVAHTAGANYAICSAAKGEKSP
ncbi:MAG TPA: hypothetical protein VMZ90_07855, partial [Vicinamibacterales bacterium]|nr:hypothetical protein [Vicinamibacterales bacterium]